MKTENLIEIMDSVGTRNIYKAYKAAYLGKGRPEGCPEKFWESIKIWENFNEVNDNDKSVFELDKESAENQIKENQSGMKQKYLQDSLKLAKDHDKLIGGSKEAKKDVEVAKQRIKESESGADMDYLQAKKDLATKYDEDYKKSTENMSEDKRKNMEISQKDFNKLMAAMNKLNKHFSEEDEKEVKDEVVESETVENEDVEDEDVDSETNEDSEEEDTVEIELPTDIADAIREALDEADEDEDETDEEVVEEDEEEAVEDEEDNEEVEEEEESESAEEEFSEKFYKFSETITETIENLDKKADKLADEIQDKAEEKVVEFSKKDFIKFAESITSTIETLADRLNAIEVPQKNEITKDLSKLEETADDYEEEFVTKSDEVTTPCPECGKDPCECPTTPAPVADETPANFSKRYEGIKNFLSM